MDEGGIARHTTDFVLDELITLLFRRETHQTAQTFVEGLLDSAESGHLVVHRITTDRFKEAWNLREQLKDKGNISFTDLTSMVIMEEKGLRRVLTDDGDFGKVGKGFEPIP